MKKTSIRALPEKNLAIFQTQQKGNDCAIHSLVAAIDLLTDVKLSPEEIIEETNRIWWHGKFYRLAPGSGITPPLQARLLRYLAKEHNLPVEAKVLHLSPEVLRATVESGSSVCLVTIYWWFRHAPAIYYMNQPQNYNALKGASGHTMVFASYDPEHYSGDIPTPWGFINSWVTQGTGLFWMEDKEFRKSWGIPIPRWGGNAALVISQKDPHSQ